MSYCFRKEIEAPFDATIERVTEILQNHGFGILSTIDVREKLREKLDVDFRPYTILGACNPKFAYQALQQESWIGTMLPCNVVVQQGAGDHVEVAAIDPRASMQAIDNPELEKIATLVRNELKQVIAEL